METTVLILAILLGGLVFGSIARVIVPGHQPFSLAETTVIGMVGAAIGALLSNLVQGPNPFERFEIGTALGGVAGSVLVLTVATWVGDRLGWRKSETDAPSITEIIAGGESDRVEFKSTARWNLHTSQRDGQVEVAIAKTVAGFLNGEGGTLVIGVDDEGSPLGLDNDLSLMKSADHDRFQLWLTDYLERTLGKPALAFVSVNFERYVGGDVVVVAVDPSDAPVFLDTRSGGRTADFYVRLGNSTRKLLTDEFADYQRSRWG